MAIKPKDMAKIVDHTILDPQATVHDVKKKCDEAKEYDLTAVCVQPCYVPLATELLKNSSVKVATVVAFPLGAETVESKAYETKDAVRNGAQEIEMVVNISAIKEEKWELLREEIKAVIDSTKIAGVTKDIVTKLIIETCYLTEEEIKKISNLAKKQGIGFIKTSTGFGSANSQPEEVSLIRKEVGRNTGVETLGNVENFDDAIVMLDAGANRIGTEYGVAVVTGEGLEEE
ncbi:MAG: deoxyribose-phosphate aldolase [Bacillota bacterium]